MSVIGNSIKSDQVIETGTQTPREGLDPTASRFESSTAPKFGDLYNQIQAKYGEKTQKPREVKKTLGKDDFLRIMITQMKNQDPTNPFKAEQMATEIAQFTSVEQLHNINQNLQKLSGENRPLEHMAATNMIGKLVTIDRERFPHQEGVKDALTFDLPKNAMDVKVAILSGDTGEKVFEKELGDQKAGEVSFTWDGNKANTLPAKSGNYFFRIEAKDEKGIPIQTNPQGKGKVIGVTFEGNEPVFLVGNAHRQDKVTLRNIIRIEVEAEGGTSAKIPASIEPAKPAPFMPFQKPEPLASGTKPVQAQSQAETFPVPQIKAEQPPNLMQPQPLIQIPPEEMGFPNGLSDDEVKSREISRKEVNNL